MIELTRLKERSDRFQNSLLSSIEHFRKGDDNLGLDNFLNSIDDLENLLDIYQYSGEPKMKIDKILPAIQKLCIYIQNQDIIGITDVLEFTIYPLTKEWLEECDDE